ncbi:MAG: hypothetical protein HQM04_06775 [Magnetococcales bacterium]|nr:hypothetical protein [Magnetococcales bacterium]MBF0114731.1 hypothetical protein [Magnetococcales bacterium]
MEKPPHEGVTVHFAGSDWVVPALSPGQLKKLMPHFQNLQGEVGNDFHTRIEGTRIRHYYGRSSIKMYDKRGHILRINMSLNEITLWILLFCFLSDCVGLGIYIFIFKQQKLLRLSTDSASIINYFLVTEKPDAILGYSKQLIEFANHNTKLGEVKSKKLATAYWFAIISTVCFLLFCFMMTREIGGKEMPADKSTHLSNQSGQHTSGGERVQNP